MVRAYIPKYKLIDSSSSKKHYVYIIEVSHAGKVHKIEKRYSAFHRLYKELQKQFTISEFPPKLIRNTSHKVLELRRIGLETWLHAILRIIPLPSVVVNFLQLTNYQFVVNGNAELEDGRSPAHHPILIYSKDPYILDQDFFHLSSVNSELCGLVPSGNCMITKGVLTALYDPSFKLD